ncbi:hypothetical protein QBC36DRAFT_311118 [Triangularia setosa]|uniref:Rhodopsin domain-containing protein n=1 Tax=Triangularia setosa TaxID=2587417 RepID=A0AAN7A6Z9_9PEZI|nr:hypothetical protein QBC36DRAFT_311118 [Podospora setosa]
MSLPYVARLQLSLKKRVGISIMLTKGLSIFAFSIFKFWYTYTSYTSTNPTGTVACIFMWASLEINIGIICACLPGIRLLLSNLLRRGGWLIDSPSHISLADSPGWGGHKTAYLVSQIRITMKIQTKDTPTESGSHLPLHATGVMGVMHPARQELGVVSSTWA